MAIVTSKFGVFSAPPINRLGSMNQGNPLGPLVENDNRSKMFPHVQTTIGAAGQTRALSVRTFSFPSTNPLH